MIFMLHRTAWRSSTLWSVHEIHGRKQTETKQLFVHPPPCCKYIQVGLDMLYCHILQSVRYQCRILPRNFHGPQVLFCQNKNHENLRAPNDTPPPHWGRTLTFSGKIGRIHPRKHAVTCWIITKLVVWVLDVVPFPRWHVQEGMGEWWWNKSRINLSVKKQVPLIWNNWQHPLFYWNLVLKRKQP